MTLTSPANVERIDNMYQEHYGWLSIFIRRRLVCPNTTADLVQVTYLCLLTRGKLPEYKDSCKFLTHIAKGLVIELYRRKRVELAYLELIESEPLQITGSPENHTIVVEALVVIDSLLHRVSFREKV